ncbi:hypothetical protein Back11_52370 [Paenibacillus baekrokdamisoli]|uniref:Uncharacterized protein n=1 Tax=Paenibacillus baekrokdamisoli TaxID=1712516 RepID=A0A3G9J015_9BACL|nr:hypothetical protein [Paenibacillus baekrokdamisoli]MBB3069075.1 hypothetical protein [Paenibacillus baekrokdamisoli]BBH23892.1 hypothetical protein Back11_52370 [Paenibacillus baekrokdamisoli]
MNGKIKTAVVVATLGAAILLGTVLSNRVEGEGDTITPGSVNDPVVTKSYIDKQVADIVKSELSKQGVDQQKLQATLDGFRKELDKGQSGQSVEVVSVPLTKRLVAKDGAEFVVRAGKAVAYSSDANGISDLTDGADITNGKSVPNNHLILFPRGGRGVQAAEGQKSGLTVLVRGAYELQQQ